VDGIMSMAPHPCPRHEAERLRRAADRSSLLWDCDRPVNASAAYLFTTAERARDMRQSPVYVLNH
jgi:hypothetical protein